MGPSFTDKEKRYVLAEMIKASQLDVEALVLFVKAHHVEPDWGSMQLPWGRNMNQCIEAAERMSIIPPMKRRLSLDREEYANKRQATAHTAHPQEAHSHYTHQPSHPPAAASVPRHLTSPPIAHFTPPMTSQKPPVLDAPKRRGRPPRQDKQKRDSLRHILPQPSMMAHSPHSPLAPNLTTTRPLLPALPRLVENPRPNTSLEAHIPRTKSPSETVEVKSDLLQPKSEGSVSINGERSPPATSSESPQKQVSVDREP